MKTRFWMLAVVVAVAAMLAPAVSSASEEGSPNADNICLISNGGVNKICTIGGTPSPMDEPYIVNANGGADIIRVRSSSDCSCSCSGANSNFIYDDDLEINGGTDWDRIYGGDSGASFNFLNGDGTFDYIRGGKGDGDELSGGTGNDVMYDPEGSDEYYDGGDDYDHLRDNGPGGCDYDPASTCGLQGGAMYNCDDVPGACDEGSGTFSPLTCPP